VITVLRGGKVVTLSKMGICYCPPDVASRIGTEMNAAPAPVATSGDEGFERFVRHCAR
jgi:hypothetical protein